MDLQGRRASAERKRKKNRKTFVRETYRLQRTDRAEDEMEVFKVWKKNRRKEGVSM